MTTTFTKPKPPVTSDTLLPTKQNSWLAKQCGQISVSQTN